MKSRKIFYTIGQVADFTELPQSVLRYWETVFPVLCPKKSDGGNRQYGDDDIELIKRIKELLYEQGFTIKGANRELRTENEAENLMEPLPLKNEVYVSDQTNNRLIAETIHDLKEVIRILE